MSAHVVEDETINNIVSMIISEENGLWLKSRIKEKTGYSMDTDEGIKGFAADLHNLNIAGVTARYGRMAEELPAFQYKYEPDVLKVQALKSLQCLIYQCSEGDIPEQSTLYKMLRTIEHTWMAEIISGLAEYKECKWG